MQAGQASDDEALTPVADGVPVAVEFGSHLLVGGAVGLGGAQDDATAEGEALRRGASVGQRLKLLAEVVRQDDPGPEGTGHERPPCGWGNNRDGDRLILRHPWPGVQTLAANLRNCHLGVWWNFSKPAIKRS